jgi:outer membrane protein
MKKGLLFLALVLGAAISVNAQTKIGYTNADYILSLMPESKEVQSQLAAYEKQFTSSIQQKYQEFERKVAEYQQNAPSMIEEVRADKEAELQGLRQSLQKFQQDAEQSIIKKQQDLYKPLYEKIQNAIDKVAAENGYSHIFRAEAMLFIADEETGDISNLVLRKLGVEPPADTEE